MGIYKWERRGFRTTANRCVPGVENALNERARRSCPWRSAPAGRSRSVTRPGRPAACPCCGRSHPQDGTGGSDILQRTIRKRRLAALEPVRPAEPVPKPVFGKDAAATDTASKASNPWTRTPTPTQLARWKAIQKGRLKGLSLRAISRTGHILRDRAQVRPRRETAHQETQRQRTRQANGATQIHHRRQLAMRTNSLSIHRDGISGKQQISVNDAEN